MCERRNVGPRRRQGVAREGKRGVWSGLSSAAPARLCIHSPPPAGPGPGWAGANSQLALAPCDEVAGCRNFRPRVHARILLFPATSLSRSNFVPTPTLSVPSLLLEGAGAEGAHITSPPQLPPPSSHTRHARSSPRTTHTSQTPQARRGATTSTQLAHTVASSPATPAPLASVLGSHS